MIAMNEARTHALAALSQYNLWRDSLYGGTTATEDLLASALRYLLAADRSEQ